MSGRILIVDDEKDLCDMIFRMLKNEGFAPSLANDGDSALEMIRLGIPDLVLLDVRMPGLDGIEVLKKAKKLDRNLPIIMMTAFGGIDGAVNAMREGAVDYLVKPFDRRVLIGTINRAVDWSGKNAKVIGHDPLLPGNDSLNLSTIMGPSDAVRRIVSEIALVAKSDFTVIIQGETGTGKELVARAIHKNSLRSKNTMIAVDCGAIAETLFESEFFGHEKGAFTGATYTKQGKFELAEGGTLFMDEIGNLPLNSQLKLLRSIQERMFFRVGGKKSVGVDLRILAASNQDLNMAVRKGSFSRDLFYRLSDFTISIPPLRDRKEDILHLADRFLKATNVELGKEVNGFSEPAMDALLKYDWPGNVRQLRSTVRRAVLQAREYINTEHMFLEDSRIHLADNHLKTQDLTWIGLSLKEIVKRSTVEVEKHVLLQALRKSLWNKAKAARLLQIDYKTIHTKVKQYGIKIQEGFYGDEGEEE